MSYSLYKKSYFEFPAHDYDEGKKTIFVDLPDYKKPNFPKEWEKVGNWYQTPNNARVYFWNSGFSENFVVESGRGYNSKSKTFPAGLRARENVINYVDSL